MLTPLGARLPEGERPESGLLITAARSRPYAGEGRQSLSEEEIMPIVRMMAALALLIARLRRLLRRIGRTG
jgi:hypothetical protein